MAGKDSTLIYYIKNGRKGETGRFFPLLDAAQEVSSTARDEADRLLRHLASCLSLFP